MILGMQHNLVSLLYTVKGFIESHLSRFEEGRFRDHDEALSHAQWVMKKVYGQTERALEITRKIGLAAKSAGETGGTLESVSVKEVWEEVVEMSRKSRTALNAVDVINHISEEFPKILCHRRDLAEIFYCLVDNAIQAMSAPPTDGTDPCPTDGRRASPLLRGGEGKGKLIVRTNLGFRAGEEPVANITIADTGPGIPEEMLSSLFEPFMTTKVADKGNGLGLCIVKGLVRKNGGSISVSSFKGCGMTVTLTFGIEKSRDRESEKRQVDKLMPVRT